MRLKTRAQAFRHSGVLIGCALSLASLGDRAFAQTSSNEAEVKAAFVYNFLKFVDWPPAALPRSHAPLVIAILGEGPAADAAAKFLHDKRVGDHPLAVQRVKPGDSLPSLHALFITGATLEEAQHALTTAMNPAVLTIGDDAQFAARGGMIALFVENRKVRFDVNTDAADAKGLRVSSRLLALARFVHAADNGQGFRP